MRLSVHPSDSSSCCDKCIRVSFVASDATRLCNKWAPSRQWFQQMGVAHSMSLLAKLWCSRNSWPAILWMSACISGDFVRDTRKHSRYRPSTCRVRVIARSAARSEPYLCRRTGQLAGHQNLQAVRETAQNMCDSGTLQGAWATCFCRPLSAFVAFVAMLEMAGAEKKLKLEVRLPGVNNNP